MEDEGRIAPWSTIRDGEGHPVVTRLGAEFRHRCGHAGADDILAAPGGHPVRPDGHLAVDVGVHEDRVDRPQPCRCRGLPDGGPFCASGGPGFDHAAVGAWERLGGIGIGRRRPAHFHLTRFRIGQLHRCTGHHRDVLVDLRTGFRAEPCAGTIRHDRYDAVAVTGPIADSSHVEERVAAEALHEPDLGVAGIGRHAHRTIGRVGESRSQPPVDLIATDRLQGGRITVRTGMHRPIDLHRIADGNGRRFRDGAGNDPHLDGGHVAQRNEVRIRRLEDELIRRLAHRIAPRRPGEHADVGEGVPRKIGGRVQLVHGAAHHCHGHVIPVRIRSRHIEAQRRALKDARVLRHLHDRGVVPAGLHIDLHVADHLPHHDPLSLHLAPFPDAQGHVEFTCHAGRVPDDRAGQGLDVEFATGAFHLVGLHEILDGQAIESRAGNEVVGD